MIEPRIVTLDRYQYTIQISNPYIQPYQCTILCKDLERKVELLQPQIKVGKPMQFYTFQQANEILDNRAARYESLKR